jgi:hypothetical protein
MLSGFGSGAESFRYHQPQGLWVPALAGTTGDEE